MAKRTPPDPRTAPAATSPTPKRRVDAPLGRTPALERLLQAVRADLVRAVVLSSAGSALLAFAGAAVFAFLADFVLGVPRAVRLWHTLLIVGAPLWALWHFGLKNVRRIPDRAGLALLAQRADPDADELLVSAVGFQAEPGEAHPRSGVPGARRSDADASSPTAPSPTAPPLRAALVERVLARADARAARIDRRPLFDRSGPLQRLAAGALSAIALAAAFSAAPAHGIVFLERLLGRDTPWPNATQLAIEIPLPEGAARVRPLGEHGLEVEVARGTDVPILVRARGKAPREVQLDFGSGRRVTVARVGGGEARGGTYRTVLRGVQEDTQFAARGGDDQSGRAQVRLFVLQPPEVVGLALGIEPPAHTGRPAEVVFDRGARVVAGSMLSVVLRTDPVDVTGRARLLPEDVLIDLVPRPYPGADALEGLGFEFEATQSVRLRFELTDSRGLANPDPGLFAIDVVPDRPPELEQIAPTRTEVETSARGAVALRVLAKDDFGLARFGWRARIAGVEAWTHGDDFAAPAPQTVADAVAVPQRERAGSVRLDVGALLAAGAAPTREVAGAQIELEAFASDNAQPPQEGKSSGVRVRVLADDELLRRVQERLGRARAQAAALATLQRERRERVGELLGAHDAAETADTRGDARAISSALNGQRRIEADAETLVRDLTGVVELAVYARLDPGADDLLERLDGLLAASSTRSFQIAPWQEFIAWHAERPAPPAGAPAAGFATHLVGLANLGLELRAKDARSATEALEIALGAVDAPPRRAALERAYAAQASALARLEDLLERLSEWDDFQSVLSQTRDMLERQRGLRERTRRFANER